MDGDGGTEDMGTSRNEDCPLGAFAALCVFYHSVSFTVHSQLADQKPHSHSQFLISGGMEDLAKLRLLVRSKAPANSCLLPVPMSLL